MNIIIFGAAGFIGTNLISKLSEDPNNRIIAVDHNKEFFSDILFFNRNNVEIVQSAFTLEINFDELLKEQDIVYHLVSTTIPMTSNKNVSQEIIPDVAFSIRLLDSCVKCNVKKVVFISSGGAVYGMESNCPISEDSKTEPITSYGLQKITIEKLIYLYNYMYKLDYKIVRLANPYGPFQRPNGMLGAVTTFTYKALKNEEIIVYGDGSVIRDFIYIDDAIEAIVNITFNNSDYNLFNVGSGYGTSISEVLLIIQNVLERSLKISYLPSRSVDIPVNYLDISRYNSVFGKLGTVSLTDGVIKTIEFLKKRYKI